MAIVIADAPALVAPLATPHASRNNPLNRLALALKLNKFPNNSLACGLAVVAATSAPSLPQWGRNAARRAFRANAPLKEALPPGRNLGKIKTATEWPRSAGLPVAPQLPTRKRPFPIR